MDRRTILAVVMSLGIYYAWLAARGPMPVADKDGAAATVSAPAPSASPAPAPALGSAAAVEVAPARTVDFVTCDTRAKVSSDGGRVHDVHLDNYTGTFIVTPLYQWVLGLVTGSSSGGWVPYGEPGPAVPLSDRAEALLAGVGDVDSLPMQVVGPAEGDVSEIELVGTTSAGIEVRKVLRENRQGADACWIDVSVTWTNRSVSYFHGDLWVAVLDHPHVAGRYDAQQPLAYVDGDVNYGGLSGAGWFGLGGTQLDDEEANIPLEGPLGWFGQSDRYFGFFVVPQGEARGAFALRRLGAGDTALDGGVLTYTADLQAGASRTETYRAYVGPLVEKRLEAVDPELSSAIDLGFWAFFGYPLIWMLRGFHGMAGNWGLAIIALTFVVKLGFYPLTQRSFVAAEKMKKIQPELNAVKEQFSDNPQQLQRRQLEIMQQNQVNPLSGCLPMLVQMPVWLALNQVLLTSVDLHHARFLYLQDLTAADPYLVLPVAITVMMWVQQQLSAAPGLDPTQQQVMRYMPLVFGLMFFAFPSGLAVYVFVNMVLTILQQWFIKRTIGSQALPTVVEAG